MSREVVEAFYAGRKRTRGNARTDGRTYWLFGNAIAQRVPPEDVPEVIAESLVSGRKAPPLLAYSFAGWATQTTARHLCALGVIARVNKDGTFVNGAKVDASAWYEPAELEALARQQKIEAERLEAEKQARRAARQGREFVQMTKELFPEHAT